MEEKRKSALQGTNNNYKPNFKLLDNNSKTTKSKVRPQWTEPILDQDGNTKGWRVMPNVLAQTIVDDKLIFLL